MVKKKLYDDMSPKEQEAAVRELMLAGGTNKSVAEELGTTVNAIAGLRHRKKIPSTRSPGKAKKPKENKAKQSATPQKKRASRPKAPPAPKPAKPKAAVPPPPPEPEPEPVAEELPPPVVYTRPVPVLVGTLKPATELHDPTKYKLAASEATQCHAHDENSRQCGYERVPGSNYCALPKHQALDKARR